MVVPSNRNNRQLIMGNSMHIDLNSNLKKEKMYDEFSSYIEYLLNTTNDTRSQSEAESNQILNNITNDVEFYISKLSKGLLQRLTNVKTKIYLFEINSILNDVIGSGIISGGFIYKRVFDGILNFSDEDKYSLFGSADLDVWIEDEIFIEKIKPLLDVLQVNFTELPPHNYGYILSEKTKYMDKTSDQSRVVTLEIEYQGRLYSIDFMLYSANSILGRKKRSEQYKDPEIFDKEFGKEIVYDFDFFHTMMYYRLKSKSLVVTNPAILAINSNKIIANPNKIDKIKQSRLIKGLSLGLELTSGYCPLMDEIISVDKAISELEDNCVPVKRFLFTDKMNGYDGFGVLLDNGVSRLLEETARLKSLGN